VKVLYIESFYPQLSESYVTCEIKYLLSMGVEIEVWRELKSICPYPPQVQVYDGKLTDAIKASKPDILHLHFLSELLRMQEDIEASSIPVTIRGHSVDHAPEYYEQVSKKPFLKKIWLYPHFAEKLSIPKVEPLPSCYDPALYYPEPKKEEGLVVRACAGIPYKNIEDFIRIAAKCPSNRFVLIFAWNKHFEHHRYVIEDLNVKYSSPVEMMVNLPHADAAAIVRKAQIAIYSAYPEAHPFGMPMSVVESMASGALAFVQDHKVPPSIYNASFSFSSVEGAARAIEDSVNWDPVKWKGYFNASIKAMQNFSAPLVIPKIYYGWKAILKGEAS
jgi:hypothetical protein